MQTRFTALVLVAGLAAGCRSSAENPPAPEKQAAAPGATAALPILPPKPAVPEANPAPEPADPRAERLAAIRKDQETAISDYRRDFAAALGDNANPSDEDYRKASEKVPFPDLKPLSARARQLLDEDPDDLTAFRTIQWLISTGREPGEEKPLLALLEQHHMQRPEMGDLCSQIVRSDSALVEKLVAQSPHAEVRGKALCALAEGLKSDIETAGYLEGKSEQELAGMKEYLGEEKVAALQKLDVEATQKEVEKLYERVLAEFGDVKINAGTKRERTLGKQASAALFEIRNLAVGKTTPEIEGVDLDNVAFKLSDYRGKVVLLDFWGNW